MSSKSPEIKKIFDKILMLIAVYAGPIMTVPQVWEIYVNNKVEGVSLILMQLFQLFGLDMVGNDKI